ncbi:MAG: Terminase small subunit [Gemmataceae bacterium]|nr:Terminase small subunit [Gemmataceae bacterium]
MIPRPHTSTASVAAVPGGPTSQFPVESPPRHLAGNARLQNQGVNEPKPDRPARRTRQRPPSHQIIRFCQLWVETQNGTQSVIDAGIQCKNRNSAAAYASKLLDWLAVKKLTRRLRREALDSAQLSVNRVAQALGRIALADRGRLYDEHGQLLPPDQWPADVAATVESLETEEVFEVVSEDGEPERKKLRGYVRKVRTAKRTDALRLLAQWLKMTGAGRAGDPKDYPGPLVIGGEADPKKL